MRDLPFECAICIDSEDYEQVSILPCGHGFHSECILSYVRAQKKNRASSSSLVCPTCRRTIRGERDIVRFYHAQRSSININNNNKSSQPSTSTLTSNLASSTTAIATICACCVQKDQQADADKQRLQRRNTKLEDVVEQLKQEVRRVENRASVMSKAQSEEIRKAARQKVLLEQELESYKTKTTKLLEQRQNDYENLSRQLKSSESERDSLTQQCKNYRQSASKYKKAFEEERSKREKERTQDSSRKREKRRAVGSELSMPEPGFTLPQLQQQRRFSSDKDSEDVLVLDSSEADLHLPASLERAHQRSIVADSVLSDVVNIVDGEDDEDDIIMPGDNALGRDIRPRAVPLRRSRVDDFFGLNGKGQLFLGERKRLRI